MGKINVLSEHLSNMIAAGEVVERPSGIVKELVENSIDAQAQTIAIDIVQGGIESITITDDGEGMDAQDATTAFERHATSKMKEENDLWNIHTMGFRGGPCLRSLPCPMCFWRRTTAANPARSKLVTVSLSALARLRVRWERAFALSICFSVPRRVPSI